MQDLHNAIFLLVAYSKHRFTHPLAVVDKTPWPSLSTLTWEFFPNIGIDLSLVIDQLKDVKTVLHEPSHSWPFTPFNSPFPGTKQYIKVTIEVVDNDHVVVAWEGLTYYYRERFNKHSVPLMPGTSMRILPDHRRDVSESENMNFVKEIFTTKVLNSLVFSFDIEKEENCACHAQGLTRLIFPVRPAVCLYPPR